MVGCQPCGRIATLKAAYDTAETPATIAKISALICITLGCIVFCQVAKAQTECGRQHTETGVYICYPNPAVNPDDKVIHDGVHFSAQGNAPDGKVIGHYKLLVDGHLNYESWATPPTQKLSIETNLNIPLDSGEHTLELVIDGVGAASVKGLNMARQAGGSFCDPFFRADGRTCAMSKRTPLEWSPNKLLPSARYLDAYASLVDVFEQNLKALEADVADAAAIDAAGNVYVASHVFSDLELRKYAPTGTIVYDLLIRSCGSGFLSVAALAVDNAGRAWIAANTTGCFHATSGAFHRDSDQGTQMRGWVFLVDTSKPSALAPVFSTSISNVAYQITGIRADEMGNVYLAGTTESFEYPHETSLSISGDSGPSPPATLGFISALNSSGSGLEWSTLLKDTQPAALAVGSEGNVYITGRVSGHALSAATGPKKLDSQPTALNCESAGVIADCGKLLVAEITDQGHQLPYAAWLAGSGNQEGQAISLSSQGNWVFVQGVTDSPDFPGSGSRKQSPAESGQSFVMAMQPCKTGLFEMRSIPGGESAAPLASGVALNAFASAFSQRFSQNGPTGVVQTPVLSTGVAPACPSNN